MRFISNFFFQRTSLLAKEVEVTPPHILKEVIHFAEIIKSSSLAVANLRFKTSNQTASSNTIFTDNMEEEISIHIVLTL